MFTKRCNTRSSGYSLLYGTENVVDRSKFRRFRSLKKNIARIPKDPKVGYIGFVIS
jgi:hypothetical protein